MTKEDLFSTAIYIAMAAIILVTGFVFVRPAMEAGFLEQNVGANLGFLILALVIGILINVLLLEIGHFIGAKIGGYTVLTFNILGLCLYKKRIDSHAIGFRFKSFNGFTGETKIKPKKEKSNPMYYIFLPLVFFLLEFIVLYCVVSYIPDSKDAADKGLMFVKYGTIIISSIAACFIVYDYFPARIDSLNDGYRCVLLNKKINLIAFNDKLLYEADSFFGNNVSSLKVFDDITDFTANCNLDAIVQRISLGKAEEALNILNETIKNPKLMTKSTYDELILTKAYLLFLIKPLDEAKQFFNDTFKKEDVNKIRNCKNYESIRLYILYEGLVDLSRSEIQFALQRKKKCDSRMVDGEIKLQSKLIEIALDKVYEVNPSLKIEESKK